MVATRLPDECERKSFAMADPNDDKPAKIGPRTLVPVSVVAIVLLQLAAFSGYVINWTSTRAKRDTVTDLKLEILTNDMQQIKSMLQTATNDQWRRSGMRRWRDKLEDDNPNLKVPRVPDD